MSNQSQAAVERAIATRRERVNRAIAEELPIEEPRRLYEASRYLLDAGGKRLRPTVLLLVAESLAGVDPDAVEYRSFPVADARGTAEDADAGATDGTPLDGEATERIDVMKAAVAVEVIQSFTLIHDDIMDDDDLRRGVPAVHEEYDLSTAILAGDTLYSKAFEAMVATGADPSRSVDAVRELAETCTRICEGQALDIDFETRDAVTPDEYLEMVELKTAVLYAAAASIPAMLVGADRETVDALYGYGLDVGRAFQIQDDLLDLTTPSRKLGKQRGSDLLEGKQTIVTLHAREQGVDVDDLLDADATVTDGDAAESTGDAAESAGNGGESTDDAAAAIDDAAVEAAVDRLREAGSIQFARETARDLVASGKANLDVLPENEQRERLADIADYLVEREY